MTEWCDTTVAEIAAEGAYSVVGGPFGSALGRKDYVDFGVPVIRGAQLAGPSHFRDEDFVFVAEEKADKHRGNLAYPGDVIVTQRGTLGQIGRIPEHAQFPRYLLSQSQMKISLDAGRADGRFVLYSLIGPDAQSQIRGSTISAGVPHINLETLRGLRLRVPSIGTQRTIGRTLGAIDELIENDRRRIELLEQMAQAIYREWFVHFRYPGHETATFVDSPLGTIPKCWEVPEIGDVLELRYGKALKNVDRAGGDVAVVGSSGVVGSHDQRLLDGPSIIVGRKGNVGNVVWLSGPSWPIDTTYYVKTALPLRFVAEQLKTADFINSHAAVPGLSRDQAYKVLFLRPPDDLMSMYHEIADHGGNYAEGLRRNADALGAIRDLLLPKLVAGEIDVSHLDLDALVEAAS